MSFKSQATKQAKEKIKQTKKENTEMKTKLKTYAKHAATVIVTLAVVFALSALYNKGVEDGRALEKTHQQEVASQVAQLKTKQSR